MVTITIRGLSAEAHQALERRAAKHQRSIEAEMLAILEAAALPEARLRIGTAISEASRRLGLFNADIEAVESGCRHPPAEPMRFS